MSTNGTTVFKEQSRHGRGCPCQVCCGGDEAARATDNEIRPQRTTAARARCVVGEGGGGMSASTLSKYVEGCVVTAST